MKNNRYLIWMALILAAFIALMFALPNKISWQKTYRSDHKIPFGAYIFHDLLPQLTESDSVYTTRESLRQIFIQDIDPVSMVILAERFEVSSPQLDLLLREVHDGGHIVVAAESYSKIMLDTLGIHQEFSMINVEWDDRNEVMQNAGRLKVKAKYSNLKGEQFTFREQMSLMVFDIDSATQNVSTWATTNSDQPVMLHFRIGEGSLTLVSNPLALTNYNLLRDDNHKYASLALAALPKGGAVVYNTHFLLGGSQANTSLLRYFFANAPLRLAWIFTVFLLLIFVIFNMKRRQRIIPIIEPPQNTSLEFTETIGRLYFQKGDHANLAIKKIEYFLEQVRSRYYLDTTVLDEHFMERLSKKSGKPEKEIRDIISFMKQIRMSQAVSQKDLLSLNNKIEKFYE